MTKDEMRALLAELTPGAHVYRLNRVGNGRAKLPKEHEPVGDTPNCKVAVMFKPNVPKRTDPATQRPVQTFKPHAHGATPYFAKVAARLNARAVMANAATSTTSTKPDAFCPGCGNNANTCTC